MGVKVNMGTASSLSAFHVCDFVPGHFDDIVLGQCLDWLSIPCHSCDADPFGRNFFSNGLMPIGSPNQDEASRFPRRGSVEYANAASKSWGWDFMNRFLPCLPDDCINLPSYWLSHYPISFHGYKNATSLQNAYWRIHSRRSADCRLGNSY